jgi:hypothetical protein
MTRRSSGREQVVRRVTLSARLGCAAVILLMTLQTACGPDPITTAPGGEGPSPAGEEPAGEPPASTPTPLVSIGDLPHDFLMRQKLVAEHAGKKHRFEAVVQKQGDVLSIIGLTPFGTKAFLLRQTGDEIEFESFIDREIPFPPRHVLEDVHRSFLWHVRLPWGHAGPEGSSTVDVLGESVSERWEGGRLMERSFERGGSGSATLRIDYGEGMLGDRPPPRIRLENGWHGYSLTIETPEYRSL